MSIFCLHNIVVKEQSIQGELMSKNKFTKIAKPIDKDPELSKFENEYFTTATSEWSEYYKGFRLQLPQDTEDNKIRGSHVPEILNNIFRVLKWILSRHNEVKVLRYDLYPADADISISDFHISLTKKLGRLRRFNDKTISTTKTDKGNAIFKDLKYFWVREKGTHEAGGGIHYHCFAVFRTPDRMTQKQINDAFRESAAKSLKGLINTKLKKEDFTNRKRNKRLLESYLEQITSFRLNSIKDKPSCPYVTIPGYFWLKRDMLALEKSESQRQDISKAIEHSLEKLEEKKGHKYLSISAISKRTHSKGEPIGGVLQECIYALSYLAKTVSKHALPDKKKKYGVSQLIDKGITDTRKHQIAASTKEINRYFKEYEKHGLEMQTKSGI